MEILTMPVGPIGTNCYIVSDGDVCAIIDPGEEGRRLAYNIKSHEWEPKAILLTHSHYDHTGGVEELRKVFPDLVVYRSEKDHYHDPRVLQLYPELGPTTPCAEGDVITVGSLSFTVLETPGHTEGSVTFQCEDCLFCGDTLFAGSCGRTDMFGGDQDKMWKSLRRLGRLPETCKVYPGHMQDTTLARELKQNPYLQHALRGGDWF